MTMPRPSVLLWLSLSALLLTSCGQGGPQGMPHDDLPSIFNVSEWCDLDAAGREPCIEIRRTMTGILIIINHSFVRFPVQVVDRYSYPSDVPPPSHDCVCSNTGTRAFRCPCPRDFLGSLSRPDLPSSLSVDSLKREQDGCWHRCLAESDARDFDPCSCWRICDPQSRHPSHCDYPPDLPPPSHGPVR